MSPTHSHTSYSANSTSCTPAAFEAALAAISSFRLSIPQVFSSAFFSLNLLVRAALEWYPPCKSKLEICSSSADSSESESREGVQLAVKDVVEGASSGP